jgi:hypothetical protein
MKMGAEIVHTMRPTVWIGPSATGYRNKSAWLLEPSLCLVSIPKFMQNAGPIGRALLCDAIRWERVASAMRRWRTSADVTWRVTFSVLFLRAGEAPSKHHEWHVDRVAVGDEAYAETDYSPNVDSSSLSVCVWSCSAPEGRGASASLGTEVLLEPAHLRFPACTPSATRGLILHPRDFHEQVTGQLTDKYLVSQALRAPEQTLVGMSGSTIHRAPVATEDCWRVFFRLGKTREPYSRYSDRRRLYFLFSVPDSRVARCRAAASSEDVPLQSGLSVPL